MELKTGQNIHGFVVRERRELDEIKAVMYRMEYEKNGADLIWLDRSDDNKTFSIGFKTIPQDDTGIFHIIEHSVLNGSQKYPVKEPFVELLKSSLQTFLNAMTFPDKTMYPISSRNDQDYLNLIDVYMDAVFHPLSLVSPQSFRQEGWHYELNSPDGELVRNGVVLNEMKGAYSNPDRALDDALSRVLFPDACYGYSSGGDPVHIPELTYEQYLASHARFYHPSNAKIFLDGAIDVDAVLGRIAGFLEPFDRIDVDADIAFQAPVAPDEFTGYYEIAPDEDDADKVLLAEGWVVGRFDEITRIIAVSVLETVLCGSNEAPLTHALLEAGLAQDVEFSLDDEIQQPYIELVVRNTSLEKKEEVWNTVYKIINESVTNGLDHARINFILNRMEFNVKEKDFGNMPKGLVYAISAMNCWLYGGDPMRGLLYDDIFSELRAKVDSGYFENLLREIFLENNHHARVCMLPSKTLGEERRAAERAELAALKASWSDEQINRVIEEFKALRAHQERADTPEELASLPQLSLSDIPAESKPLAYTVGELGGNVLLHQEADTDGITYLTMHFPLEDIPADELGLISLAAEVLGKLATEKYSALELRDASNDVLGRFSVDTAVYDAGGAAKPILSVSAALLDGRRAEAAELIGEIILHTRFDDTGAFYNLLRQLRIAFEQAISTSQSAANIHAASVLSAKSAVDDEMRGIKFLRFLQKLDREFESSGEQLCAKLAALLKRIFTRERLIFNVTGQLDEAWLASISAKFPSGAVGEKVTYSPAAAYDEGFKIAADIGYSALCGTLRDAGMEFSGAMRVAANLLRYDYLWNEVRVKGGAYGTSMLVADTGEIQFSSYRDPRCAQSLDTFAAAGEALRSFCESGESPEKYIISTIGDLDGIVTPRMESLRAANMYFSGRTEEDRRRIRREVLSTTVDQLRAFGDALDKVCAGANACVIGGQSVIDACGGHLKNIESLT